MLLFRWLNLQSGDIRIRENPRIWMCTLNIKSFFRKCWPNQLFLDFDLPSSRHYIASLWSSNAALLLWMPLSEELTITGASRFSPTAPLLQIWLFHKIEGSRGIVVVGKVVSSFFSRYCIERGCFFRIWPTIRIPLVCETIAKRWGYFPGKGSWKILLHLRTR